MLKIKCFSLLLVLILLLLLFISCDSGSKAGAGTNTGAGGGAGSGTNTGVGAGGGAELKDEDELAYLEDKVIDPELMALLDQFGVSGPGRKAIGYIGGKFRDSGDVHKRLNALGADVVIEKIIKPTVSLLKARGEALKVKEDPTNESIKTRLQDMLNRYDTLVESVWHDFFHNRLIEEDMFVESVTYYVPKFSKFKEMVKHPRVIDVYAWLDADDCVIIDEIEKIVVNATYDQDRFNNMLNSLGDANVIAIIKIYRDIKIDQGEALKAIDSISDDIVKQAYQDRFNTLQGEYDSHIRDAFNKASGELYAQIIGNGDKYRNDFIGSRNNARAAKFDEEAAAAAKEAKEAEEAAAAAERAKEAKEAEAAKAAEAAKRAKEAKEAEAAAAAKRAKEAREAEAAAAAKVEESTEAAAAAKVEESTEAGEPREGSGTDEESGATGSGS
ncbi:hypothetical protein A7978_04945 (plasmid) [Borrelia turicatae]|uniref:Uncharacterized protein n=1 Tax=Borrelia turicatae TaxID=142 RepID=A0A172XD20_BORTU|nr:DUF1617 family protein [Borrelia turicatae]ANF34458.1 hypothetical protein A7978_04945 [Borrelia turicatae]UPA15538.1 DUF1617 family protein [Borrelia turicatae]